MTTNRRALPLSRVGVAAVLILALSGPTPAHAAWPLAEGELFLSVDGSIAADSNIASNATELSDTIYTVTPGFTWERSRGRGSVTFSANCAIERASEYSSYDSENYSADFSLSMPATASGRLKGNLDLSYFDGSRVDQYLNTRIAERGFNGSLDGSYQISNRINGRASVSYGESQPENAPSYEESSMSLGLGYNLRQAISAFVDFRFTDSSSESSPVFGPGSETSGNAIMFGLDGQITSRLSGSMGIGYDKSESEAGSEQDETSGMTYDVSLTWTPRTRTTFNLRASNGVQSTSVGNTEYVTIALTGSQEIGLNMTADVGVSFRSSDFGGTRTGGNDFVEAFASLDYRFSSRFSISGKYTYSDSDSTDPIVVYQRDVWLLSASARF
ncbi:MAG: outer membrane beta-barrel protein [Opitutaceae bacterium]|nr:outer membrane beta-barrel protein [Opitutaceae bacterium]